MDQHYYSQDTQGVFSDQQNANEWQQKIFVEQQVNPSDQSYVLDQYMVPQHSYAQHNDQQNFMQSNNLAPPQRYIQQPVIPQLDDQYIGHHVPQQLNDPYPNQHVQQPIYNQHQPYQQQSLFEEEDFIAHTPGQSALVNKAVPFVIPQQVRGLTHQTQQHNNFEQVARQAPNVNAFHQIGFNSVSYR